MELALAADFLFGAIASLLVTLLNQRARAVLPANVHFSAVSAILAIEDVGAGLVVVLKHVAFDLAVVVHHGHAVRQILGAVDFLLMIEFNFVSDFIDLALDVVKGPLLRFLHLNHHLLDLLELLEAVSLHLLELFLLGYKHIQPCLLVTEESVLNHVAFLVWDGDLHGCLRALVPGLVEFVSFARRGRRFLNQSAGVGSRWDLLVDR